MDIEYLEKLMSHFSLTHEQSDFYINTLRTGDADLRF